MSARLPDEVWVEFLSRVTAGRAGQSVCKDKDMPAGGQRGTRYTTTRTLSASI